MKRRGFLAAAAGVAGSAVAFMAAWAGRHGSAPALQPRLPLVVLQLWAFEVLAAVAEAVLQGEPVDGVQVAHDVEGGLRHLPLEVVEDLRRMLGALDNPVLGLLLDGRPSRFVTLPVPERMAALNQWRFSRLPLRRSGYQALRRLCARAHYLQRRTWVSVGYPGPPAVGGTP